MTQYGARGFNGIPTIVKNLIIINVILAVLQHVLWGTFKIDLADYLGLHYFRSDLFRPWQFLTHLFMHGDKASVEATLFHLLSNMFALWMFGSILENRWGPKRFLTFYLICGLGAALCHLGVLSLQYEPVINGFHNYVSNPTLDQFNLFANHHLKAGSDPQFYGRLQEVYNSWTADPGNTFFPKLTQQRLHDYIYGARAIEGFHVNGLVDEATVGASGAVFGVLFAFGYLFPNLQLMLIFLPIPIKAKWFVTIYAVFELYSGIRNSAGDNVAHFAHLGGMLFAFILLKIWRYRFGDRVF
jgi:membrane associated rhomboid family serine protease